MTSMEECFEFLISANNNNVETLIKWLKDSGVTSEADEGTTRKYFADNAPDPQSVTLSQFRAVLFLIAEAQKVNEQALEDRLKTRAPSKDNLNTGLRAERSAECYFYNLCKTGKSIDRMYDKLSSEGKDTVNSIIQFLKDTTIMDALHVHEEEVRNLLADLNDGKVNRHRFRELMFGLGQSSGTEIAELTHDPSTKKKCDSDTEEEAVEKAVEEAVERGTSAVVFDGPKCYFTTLCWTATVIDETLDRLVQEGKTSIAELIDFLQETTIMDAFEDKKREMLGLPPLHRPPRASIISQGSASNSDQSKPGSPTMPAPATPKISSNKDGTQSANNDDQSKPGSPTMPAPAAPKISSNKVRSATAVRSSTSEKRLSGQRPNRQFGSGQQSVPSGQRRSGQKLSESRGETKRKT